jgi:predicted Zn-dependent protease
MNLNVVVDRPALRPICEHIIQTICETIATYKLPITCSSTEQRNVLQDAFGKRGNLLSAQLYKLLRKQFSQPNQLSLILTGVPFYHSERGLADMENAAVASYAWIKPLAKRAPDFVKGPAACVAKHEFGHLLKLMHCPRKLCVMNWYGYPKKDFCRCCENKIHAVAKTMATNTSPS